MGEGVQVDNQRLNHLYYTPEEPESLSGARGLYRRLKKNETERAKKWLRGQDAYTLHKKVVTKFPRRPTIVAGPGEQVQVDLMDVSRHAGDNAGTKFLLTAIDVFSRKAWIFPLQSKGGEDVSRALKRLFEREKFRAMQSDKGKEFYNTRVQSVLSSYGIHHFSTENETIKAAIVERFNQTLRKRLYRYMTRRDDEHYLPALQNVVDSYNDSFHTSIGMTPNQVNVGNQEMVWQKLYDSPRWATVKSPKLSVGDHVRISKHRGAFERGYTPNWSVEVYVVHRVKTDTNPIVYVVRDWADEVIKGTFYEQELQLIDIPDSYRIEKVLKSRRRRGKKEIFVKWLGYPDSFNEWVNEKDFV